MFEDQQPEGCCWLCPDSEGKMGYLAAPVHGPMMIMVSMVSMLLLCEGGDASPLGAASHTNNWAVLVCTSRYWFSSSLNPSPVAPVLANMLQPYFVPIVTCWVIMVFLTNSSDSCSVACSLGKKFPCKSLIERGFRVILIIQAKMQWASCWFCLVSRNRTFCFLAASVAALNVSQNLLRIRTFANFRVCWWPHQWRWSF